MSRRNPSVRRLAALLGLLVAAGLLAAALAPAAGPPSRILFVRESRFDFVTPAGRPVETIGFPERAVYFPTDIAASRDGSRIAVLSPYGAVGAAFGRFTLEVHFAGESGLRTIPVKRPQLNVALASVALSPDGRTLALSIASSIVLIDLESGRRHALRKGYLLRPDLQPSFAADGRHLVFVHEMIHSVDQSDVYETDLHGGDLRRLTETPTSESFPVLSPDGSHLAFLRKVPGGKGQYEVVVASAEDTEERVIGRTDYALGGPEFSPDGGQVLFTAAKRTDSSDNGPYSIYAVDVEGGERRLVLRSAKGPLIAQWVAGR